MGLYRLDGDRHPRILNWRGKLFGHPPGEFPHDHLGHCNSTSLSEVCEHSLKLSVRIELHQGHRPLRQVSRRFVRAESRGHLDASGAQVGRTPACQRASASLHIKVAPNTALKSYPFRPEGDNHCAVVTSISVAPIDGRARHAAHNTLHLGKAEHHLGRRAGDEKFTFEVHGSSGFAATAQEWSVVFQPVVKLPKRIAQCGRG